MNTEIAKALERPLRVLVADDHPVVRAGIVAMLERDPGLQVVFQASHGAEAVMGWRTHLPDIGLIDLNMPGLDGFGTLAAIRSTTRFARLVAMTTFSGGEDVYRALQAGVGGYLLKDCGAPELIACIRAVARGQRYLQAVASASLAERIASDSLTARETEVLQWLTEGLSNKAIGRRMGVAEGTVKTHMKGLLPKLGVDSRTQAVRLALQRGLVRLPQAGKGPEPQEQG